MYSNIKVHQKYLVTSIKVGCATRSMYASSGPKAEGVPTNNQRRNNTRHIITFHDLERVAYQPLGYTQTRRYLWTSGLD